MQPVKFRRLINCNWSPFIGPFRLRYSLINTLKVRYHSIRVCTAEFSVTPPHPPHTPQPQTQIFGQVVTFYDSPQITFFGHINNPGSSFVYINLFKIMFGGGGGKMECTYGHSVYRTYAWWLILCRNTGCNPKPLFALRKCNFIYSYCIDTTVLLSKRFRSTNSNRVAYNVLTV